MAADSATIRVFLTDDHEVVRRGLADLLGLESDKPLKGRDGQPLWYRKPSPKHPAGEPLTLTAPIAVGIMGVAPQAPKLVDRIGTTKVVVLGLLITAGAMACYASNTLMSRSEEHTSELQSH